MPLLLRGRSRLAGRPDLTGLILGIRRTAIVLIVLLGYAYFRLAGPPEGVDSTASCGFSSNQA